MKRADERSFLPLRRNKNHAARVKRGVRGGEG